MFLRNLFALLFVCICAVRAGTWLAFNDFGDADGGFGGDHSARGNLRDLVHACRQNPKVSADGYAEHEAMCRILLRMTRSA